MGASSSSKSAGVLAEDKKFSGFLDAVCEEEQNTKVSKDKFIVQKFTRGSSSNPDHVIMDGHWRNEDYEEGMTLLDAYLTSSVQQKSGSSSPKLLGFFPEEARGLAGRLHGKITSQTEGSATSRAICHQTLQEITGAETSTAHVKLYLKLYGSDDSGKLTSEDCLDLLKVACYFQFQISAIKFEDATKDEELLKNLAATILAQGEQQADWFGRNCSDLFSALHTWLTTFISGNKEAQGDVAVVSIPPSSILNGVSWWLLTSTLPSVFSQSLSCAQSHKSTKDSQSTRHFWSSLYSSHKHGVSLNRFQHHVFDYRGPTLLLLTCDDGYCFALAVEAEWREGTTPWGGDNSFLIQVAPEYRIVEEGGQLVVFNEKSRNIPKGLFIGRDRTRYSLKITDGLQQAEHDGQSVNIIDIEVWGCGGSGASAHQADQKMREKKDAERNAKVKMPGEWDKNPDRLLLQWGGAKPSYQDQFRAELAPDAMS